MYFLFFILLMIAFFSCILFHIRKKRIIKKIKCMDECQKCSVIEELVKPFGYCYHCRCGFFSATLDAWQRKAGYTWFYDYMAPRFQMVFDALPIYFDYRGRTWLIEFWKGQYGINTGAEIGIYHADEIIAENAYKTTLFECASDEELLNCSLTLCDANGDCVKTCQKHWWITAFLTGCFTQPYDLCLKSTLTFPNGEMQSAFIDGMYRAGYTQHDFVLCGLSLTFTFLRPKKTDYNLLTRFWRRFSQWKNKISCRLYLWVTKPFQSSEDRILCLYYCIPIAFRKLLRMRRFHKRCHKKRRCCRRRS